MDAKVVVVIPVYPKCVEESESVVTVWTMLYM